MAQLLLGEQQAARGEDEVRVSRIVFGLLRGGVKLLLGIFRRAADVDLQPGA